MAFGQNRSGAFASKTSHGTANKKEWMPKVVSGRVEKNDKTGEDVFVIHITWIFPQDRMVILSNSNQIDPDSFQIGRNFNDNNGILLKIELDKLDKFKNVYLPQFIDIIRKRGNYASAVLDSLGSSIIDCIDATPTSDEINKSQDNIAKTWQDLLSKMNDPETRKKMLLFQTSVAYEREYGSKLSKTNIREILSQDPNATFVTNERTWRDVFDRRIVDRTKFIIINKAENRSYSLSELDNAARKIGYKNYKEAMNVTQGSTQVKHAIEKIANTVKGGQVLFYREKAYDVANTVPNDPFNDKWVKCVGLANNLTGLLNGPAMEKEREYLTAQGKEIPKAKEGADEQELEEIKKELLKYCEEKHLRVNNIGDNSDIIAGCVYEIAINEAPKYNILRDENKKAFASLVVMAVSAVYNISSSQAKNFFSNMPREVTKEQALDIYEIFKTISNKMNTKMVAESVNNANVSPNDFINILNNIGVTVTDGNEIYEDEKIEEEIIDDNPMERLSESFHDLLNRIIW